MCKGKHFLVSLRDELDFFFFFFASHRWQLKFTYFTFTHFKLNFSTFNLESKYDKNCILFKILDSIYRKKL